MCFSFLWVIPVFYIWTGICVSLLISKYSAGTILSIRLSGKDCTNPHGHFSTTLNVWVIETNRSRWYPKRCKCFGFLCACLSAAVIFFFLVMFVQNGKFGKTLLQHGSTDWWLHKFTIISSLRRNQINFTALMQNFILCVTSEHSVIIIVIFSMYLGALSFYSSLKSNKSSS